MSPAGPPDQAKQAQNRGTASGLFALAVFSLLWVLGWWTLTGAVPVAALLWWFGAWALIALIGYPRSS